MESKPMYSYYGNGLWQEVNLEYDENGKVKAIRYGKPKPNWSATVGAYEQRQIERDYHRKLYSGRK